jgi:hypothetical protein
VAEQTTSTAKAARGCGLQMKHASAASGHEQNYTGIQMAKSASMQRIQMAKSAKEMRRK